MSCLIAIVGGSGAGKSWLAERLQGELGELAGRIALDDFYRDGTPLPEARRARRNFDHPLAIDWKRFGEVLDDLSHDREAAVPQYDFTTHCRRPDPVVVRPRPVMLIEGLLVLHRPSLRRRFSLGIFVDCPARQRLARRLARDVLQRGRSAISVREQFHRQVQPMHARFVAPQRRLAEALVRSPVTADQVHRLASRIRDLAGH